MRTLLLAAALAFTSSLSTPTTAEACGGGYGARAFVPRTFAVSSHFIPRAEAADGRRRTFVLLGSAAPDGLVWERLAPMSYDSTQIAPAPTAPASTLTLVGPKGTRVITSARYVYLKQTFELRGSSLAVEFDLQDGDDFRVALAGNLPNASWSEPKPKSTTKDDAAWLRARGLSGAHTYGTYIESLVDGIDVLSAYDSNSKAQVSVIRSGTYELARQTGWVLGTILVGGERYLAVRDQATTRLVAF